MSLRVEAGFHHLKDALAEVLAKEVEFPPGVFVTVLDTKVTANTVHAKVVLSVMPENRQKDVLDTLANYQHEINQGLTKRLRLRRIPHLHYVFDTTEAEAAVIENEINRLADRGEITPVQKAGAIIVRPGVKEPEALLLYRARNHNDWSFPKGHCEPGESLEETALREIQEETGLDIQIIRRLPDIEYLDSYGRDIVLAMYLTKPKKNSPAERPEKDGDRVVWVPFSKVEDQLTHDNLKKFFGMIKQEI